MQGHAGEGDRRQLAEMRATGIANGTRGSGKGSPLRYAAQAWLRRGYRIEYDDEHLVQLTAPFRTLAPRDLLLSAIIGAGLGALGTLGALGYLWTARRGRRHIVSLLLTPERQVITHNQWQAAATPE